MSRTARPIISPSPPCAPYAPFQGVSCETPSRYQLRVDCRIARWHTSSEHDRLEWSVSASAGAIDMRPPSVASPRDRMVARRLGGRHRGGLRDTPRPAARPCRWSRSPGDLARWGACRSLGLFPAGVVLLAERLECRRPPRVCSKLSDLRRVAVYCATHWRMSYPRSTMVVRAPEDLKPASKIVLGSRNVG